MIRLKLAAFDKEQIDLPGIDGEFLDQAVRRSLEGIPLGDRKPEEIFQALVNGHKIDSGLWSSTKLVESDQVLIAPEFKGDDPGAVFRGVLQIVITAAAYYFLGPSGGLISNAFLQGLAIAGASMVGAMALNALIPPSVPSASPLAGAPGMEDSQMYSITGQSNQLKQHSFVPKVLGQHRIFPNIAANPYVEIETGDSGKLIHTLYAVYDFGLGPGYLSSVKIGDTPIEQFPDCEYRVVDLNKPAVSEGPWDDQSYNFFQHYKGDNESESFALSIDGNRSNPSDPQDTWQIIRTAPPNSDGSPQTISLQFTLPRGLYGSSAAGAIGQAIVELEIHFAKVGTEDWRAANDPDYVSYFSEDGGFDQFQPKSLTLIENSSAGYAILNPYGESVSLLATDAEVNGATLPPKTGKRFQATRYDYGILAGTVPTFIVANDIELTIGSSIRSTIVPKPPPGVIQKITPYPPTIFLGKVAAMTPVGVGYTQITMDRPVTNNVVIVQRFQGTLYSTPQRNISRWGEFTGVLLLEKGVIGKGKISRSSVEPQFATYKFSPKETADYKIRITRVTTLFQYGVQTASALTLSGITVRFDRSPIKSDKRHIFLEVKIRATGQLNGVIQNLSGVVTSAVDVWNGSAWVKQLSRNPAWIFAELMTGAANKRPLDKSRLHTASLLEWANFCDTVPSSGTTGMTFVRPRFQCDFVLDFATTLQGLLNQVGSSAQASLNIIDGKYGVLIDRQRTVPVQIFTPRNSSNFTSSRVYSRKPHALKVKYVDSDNDWQQGEAVIYEDGYTAATATEFEEITAFGCTNFEQAWRYGRYILASHRLRQETISIQVDFEHLVCTRGDYVKFVHDVMRVGGRACRVRSISGNRITIDDALETLPVSYGFTFRSAAGSIKTNTLTVVDARTFDLNGPDLPAVGDMIVIGEVGFVTIDCLVKSITPSGDHQATIVLVEKADAIHDAESTSDFPVYDPQLNQTTIAQYSPPGEVRNLAVTDNSYEIVGRAYRYFIELDWDSPLGSAFEYFEVYVNYGQGYNRIDTTRESFYEYTVNEANLDVEHSFKVLAVSANGLKKELVAVGDVTATPAKKMTLPTSVTQFSSDITGETLLLLWNKVADLDISEYRIRYSPDVDSTVSWSQSVPLLRADANVTSASVQARTGTYLIKSVDFNGNESATPGIILTTIPSLFGLNQITTLDDFPALAGNMDRVEILSGTLVLQQEIPGDVFTRKYFTEGYYYFDTILDLQDIYSVRLQSLIRAVGFTVEDVMANWETLVDVHLLQHARSADWDAELQYRSTNQLNVMSDWNTLSEVEALDAGSPVIWTPFRKFTIGDATGRIFQFRLKLISNKPSVTPRVLGATVQVDTPDRVESYNNLVATITGFEQSYSPPFLGPGTTPNIQITLENGQAGDYWEFEFKTLSGFKIHFYDANDVEVSRQFDAFVKGYGRKANEVI